jgi:predicted DNA-binding protein
MCPVSRSRPIGQGDKLRSASGHWGLRRLATKPLLMELPRLRAEYNLVILSHMKTAISLSDETFQRVDHAARRLGVSRSEFFAQAAERWLDALEDDGTTDVINRVIAGLTIDHAFTDAAAAALAAHDHV